MDIKPAVDEYLGSKKNSITAKSYRWYAYHLDRFISWCEQEGHTDLARISAAQIQQAVSAYDVQSTYSKHGYAQVVKGFMNWCSQDEDFGVRTRTVSRIELPKIEVSEVALFTDAHVKKLFETAKRMPLPYRAQALVHILLDTGVRASELCYDGARPEESTGLRMQGLFLGREDSYIRVMGKGRKSRTVGMGVETVAAMRRYMNRERGRSACEYVFLSRRDAPLSVRMLEQFVSDLGELAGIEDCHPHRFRHTFAVNCLLNGVSELVLMKLLGHSSLDATRIYTRAMSEMQAMKSAPSVVDSMRKKKP